LTTESILKYELGLETSFVCDAPLAGVKTRFYEAVPQITLNVHSGDV